MSSQKVVVIGAGHAGVQVAARLAELHYRGQIVLIDAEPGLPYERPPLSKDFLKSGACAETVPLRKEHFYKDKGIEFLSGAKVVEISRVGRHVVLEDGRRISYGKLVLAAGSQPRVLPVPGGTLPGVLLLKTYAQALALKQELVPGARVVIIGAGYIGLEVAAAAAQLGCQTTVLEAQDRVMSRVTCAPVSRYFEVTHRSMGTDVVLATAITEVQGGTRVERVVTSDGRAYRADVVLVGIGVAPDQDLAEEAGLACSDGIVVGQHGQTSDLDVYAAGDAARLVLPGKGVSLRLESVPNAQTQAIRVANHIAGHAEDIGEVPWFWTVQHGIRLQTAGLRHPDDRVVIRGSVEDGQFAVLYLRAGRLAAIDTVGSLRDFMPAKKLIASQARLDPRLAADRSVHLMKSAA